MAKAKEEKRYASLTEKYKKGLVYENKNQLIEFLKQGNVIAYILEASAYNDDTESLTIKIDRIKP